MFRRKSESKLPPSEEAPVESGDLDTLGEVDTDVETASAAEASDRAPDATSADVPRGRGPWDISEIMDEPDRINLGSLLIKGVPGLSMQVQVDEKTQRVTMVTLVLEDAAVQVQAFAAPRSGGIWNEVRPAIATTVTTSGGLVEEAEGPFGTELRARVPGPNKELQPARFVGVDGPRWFLRGLFLGRAATPQGHDALTAVFSDIAVDRGDEAKPSGEPLPLALPERDDAQSNTVEPSIGPTPEDEGAADETPERTPPDSTR